MSYCLFWNREDSLLVAQYELERYLPVSTSGYIRRLHDDEYPEGETPSGLFGFLDADGGLLGVDADLGELRRRATVENYVLHPYN